MNKKFWKTNYKTIVGVTFLAFLLWFMVKMNKDYDYEMNIPIRFANIDEGKILKYREKSFVRVEFTGKGKDLLRLPFYHLYYQVDLSDAPLHFELDLSQHHQYINLPTDLKVAVKSIVRPRILTIDLDKKEVMKVPVKVDYNLTTPPGYTLVSIEPQPDSVEVTGPQSMFRNLNALNTVSFDFKDASKAFNQPFPIQKPDDYYLLCNPDKIDVFFNIQRLAERQIPDIPVTVINVPSNLEVVPLPSTATIYVKGGEKILANLTDDDFKILIDFRRDWKPSANSVMATLVTSANVLYMKSIPPEFELIVQKKHK